MSPPDSEVPAPQGPAPTTTLQVDDADSSSPLRIPELAPDADTLTAALTYADAGWYVLPVKRGTKHPGTVVGDHWHHQSSRHPQQIVAWFAGTDHGIALHCGRSGAVMFDVDSPSKTPDALACHLGSAPYQSTRADTLGRGHYVFTQPPGRMLGNSGGRLGGAWGEVRGLNGVIIVAPSVHPEGGCYRWVRTGPIPALPDDIADLLDDANPATDAASDATVAAFLAGHAGGDQQNVLQGLLKKLHERIAAGESRHMSTVPALVGAMKEARAGLYPALWAAEAIWAVFLVAVAQAPVSDKQGAPRTGAVAAAEFRGMLAWAVGQALVADPDEVRARVADRMHDSFAWAGELTAASTNGHAVAKVAPDAVADDGRPLYAGHLLTRSALRDLPSPQPLIGGVLDQGTCALLYGHRATFKSFIAFDWNASVGTGRDWQGRRTEQRRGLYVAAEGAHGYPGRFDAWEAGWRRPIDDGAVDLLPRPVNLMVPAEVANLGALIDWGGYGFVVLDTTARCTLGGDENSAKDMGLVVDRLYYLLDKTPGRRGVILAVHHTGKDGKTLRGSSALEAGVDTVYSATRDGAVVTLNREKRKDGPELDRHLLRLDPIAGTDSCCLKAAHGETTGETAERTAALRLIVSHHFVSTGATGAELRRLAVDDGTMSRASYYRALTDLVESGYLVNTGTDKRPFYKVNDE